MGDEKGRVGSTDRPIVAMLGEGARPKLLDRTLSLTVDTKFYSTAQHSAEKAFFVAAAHFFSDVTD